MNFDEFKSLAKKNSIITLHETITADLITPVMAYLKVREHGKMSFLFESVEGSMKLARYSFIGCDPERVISNKNSKLSIIENNNETMTGKNLFTYLREFVSENFKSDLSSDLPDFCGGLVGFIGYENIGLIEPTVQTSTMDRHKYDSCLGLFNTILAFDHYKHKIILITNVKIHDYPSLESAFLTGKENLSKLKIKLNRPIEHISDFKLIKNEENNFDFQRFKQKVNMCKHHIEEGDIFQIVLSEKFISKYEGDLINVYRALRIINPSPYMYFIEYPNQSYVIGTSPEDLVKVKKKNVTLLPIAGTRRRGSTIEEDTRLETELLNDQKEIAEHTMLLDLGRNDLGRVCNYDSVKVTKKMEVIKYSHVMHLVSKIEGELDDNYNSIDAFQACFPAGTVTGAPKIEAMKLINKFEETARNIYAGAVGYIDFAGNLDTCIAIRTIFATNNQITWQAGAGIVADSIPENEVLEIKNKAAVIISALNYAEVIDEDISNR